MIGQTISHYKILEKLGCGKCFEPHRATHTEVVKYERLRAEWIVPKTKIEGFTLSTK
jgi:hypothetical protein